MRKININIIDLKIDPNHKRILPLFFNPPGKKRFQNIISKILSLTDNQVLKTLNDVVDNFKKRHFSFKNILLKHFQNVEKYIPKSINLSNSQKLLIGSYFTKEYSIEAAALFNPSIIEHPNQSNLNSDEIRFIISLRATGEGHISSIVFRSGIFNNSGVITLDAVSSKATQGKINIKQNYSKSFIKERVIYYKSINKDSIEELPNKFNLIEAINIIKKSEKSQNSDITDTLNALKDIFETNYEIHFAAETPLSARTIFPHSPAESCGMEDARFVKFIDNGEVNYYGTYTAYDGKHIKTQLIETKDFVNFKIRRLYGNAIQDKGMALFPRKNNDNFAMIGRQGGEKISIMFSKNLYFWDTYKTIYEPTSIWEISQVGNNGSPIKTKKGWLLMIHGVGPFREYVISAILLDLKYPEKVIGTLELPLLKANENEREGYVPNVVYSCGVLAYKDNLILPYAMSDSKSGIATISIKEILNKFKIPKK